MKLFYGHHHINLPNDTEDALLNGPFLAGLVGRYLEQDLLIGGNTSHDIPFPGN